MQSNDAAQRSKITPIDGRRTPPNSIDAEQSVLGGILVDPNSIERIVHSLSADYFYTQKHQIIFDAMVSIYQSENQPDITAVTQWLAVRDLLDKVGGVDYIGDLFDSCVTAASIDFHAAAIVETWKRRQLIEVCQEIATAARDMNANWQSVQETAESKIFELVSKAKQSGLEQLCDISTQELMRIQSVMNGEVDQGLLTGLYDLDAMTQGFRPYELIIIAGRPGMGKTSIALTIAANVAKHGKRAAFFSLEMSKAELTRKVISSITSISGQRLETGIVSEQEWSTLLEVQSDLAEYAFEVDDSADLTPSIILSSCRALIAQKGGLDCVIVDYLHLMAGGDGDNEVRELGKITRAFKKMAKQLSCPIILLSQLSRGVESKNNKRPAMSDLRSSGRIEEDADKIILLYREEYYNPDTEDKGIAEVILGKNRSGPTGTVKLLFDPEFSRFRNISTPQSRFNDPVVVPITRINKAKQEMTLEVISTPEPVLERFVQQMEVTSEIIRPVTSIETINTNDYNEDDEEEF